MIRKYKMPIITLLALTLFSAALWARVQDNFYQVKWEKYVVESGDTLWTIAGQSNVEQDPRDIIAIMQDYNNIKGANIHPGDVILYPVKTK